MMIRYPTVVLGFNRNILGCKDLINSKVYLPYIDLIETYWDVKYFLSFGCSTASFGFNRNILGCKVIMEIALHFNTNDLIETYWDVKRDVEVLSVHDFAI